MNEYNTVLAAQPEQREVAMKISEYYVRVGDEALQQNDLEAARRFYADFLGMEVFQTSSRSIMMRLNSTTTIGATKPCFGRLTAQRGNHIRLTFAAAGIGFCQFGFLPGFNHRFISNSHPG